MLYSIKDTQTNEILYSSNDIQVIRISQPFYNNSYISYSQEAIDMINDDALEVIEAKGETLLVNKNTSDIFLVSSNASQISANIMALTMGAYDNDHIS